MSLLFTTGCFMLVAFMFYTQTFPVSFFDQISQMRIGSIPNLDPFYAMSGLIF